MFRFGLIFVWLHILSLRFHAAAWRRGAIWISYAFHAAFDRGGDIFTKTKAKFQRIFTHAKTKAKAHRRFASHLLDLVVSDVAISLGTKQRRGAESLDRLLDTAYRDGHRRAPRF